jgi:hypothetical protein
MMKRLKKLFIMMMSLTIFLSLAYTQVCAYGYKLLYILVIKEQLIAKIKRV